jgi:hypothetical protein
MRLYRYSARHFVSWLLPAFVIASVIAIMLAAQRRLPMKNILLALSFCLFALAQQREPKILNRPAQRNPMNILAGVAGLDTAIVTIPGLADHRVRIYSITAVCNAPGTTTVPTIIVTDAGRTIVSNPNQSISNEVPPIRPLHWQPGLTASPGGEVVIMANYGAACGGGTTLSVQADQF